MNKKILALIVISNFSVYSVFAQQDPVGINDGKYLTDFVCPYIKNYLSRGTTDQKSNGEVTKLQKFLKQNMHLNDQQFLATGSYGKVTETFVKQFQKKNKLVATGMIGGATRNKIASFCSDAQIDLNKKVSTKYKDGSYNVTASYGSPGGQDNLGVSITLANDKVTNVIITKGANDNYSEGLQRSFIGAISKVVVGEALEKLNIGVVSGASLTSRSFNDALGQIRAQALN